jgi:hypothetical protein
MSRPLAQPPTVDEFVKRTLESSYHVLRLIHAIEGNAESTGVAISYEGFEGKIWTTQPPPCAGDELMSLDLLRSIARGSILEPEVLDYDLT